MFYPGRPFTDSSTSSETDSNNGVDTGNNLEKVELTGTGNEEQLEVVTLAETNRFPLEPDTASSDLREKSPDRSEEADSDGDCLDFLEYYQFLEEIKMSHTTETGNDDPDRHDIHSNLHSPVSRGNPGDEDEEPNLHLGPNPLEGMMPGLGAGLDEGGHEVGGGPATERVG